MVIDHSGSMGSPSTVFRGKTRMQEVQEAAETIARAAEAVDSDGITVIPFSSKAAMVDNVTSSKVAQVFQEYQPSGSTALDRALALAVEKARKSSKRVGVVVYTDGEPNDHGEVIRVLEDAGKLGRSKIGFTFVQVGQDAQATRFLRALDDDLDTDIVDVVPAERANDLSLAELMYCAFNG